MAKVVLIGGGITAALMAVRLAESGFEITVIEKAAIGNGSSSRAAGGIRGQFRSIDTIVGMMYAKWWYENQFHEKLKTSAEIMAIQQNGYLFLYEDSERCAPLWKRAIINEVSQQWETAQQYAALQQNLGLPVEILSPEQICKRWPHISVDRLIGATWCQTDGLLFPEVIYTEGFRRARELGVEVREHTEVIAATHQGGKIHSIETTGGSIEADWFINCTNAWGAHVSRRLGGMELAISPTKRYTYWLQTSEIGMAPADFGSLPMTIYGQGGGKGALSRPAGNLLKMLWAHDCQPDPNFTDADQDSHEEGFRHDHRGKNFGREVYKEIRGFWPALKGILKDTTSGYYGVTPDGSPLIGIDLYQSNLVHAVGFSGHGAMHAPTTAFLVDAIISRCIRNNQVSLPAPYSDRRIWVGAFAPERKFSETMDVII